MNFLSIRTVSFVACFIVLGSYNCVHSISSVEKDLTITWEQKNILDKFRTLVQDRLPHKYMNEDLYLIRWLRAKRFNIEDAQQALMSNLKWREENKMDGIHQEDWSEYESYYPYWLEGRDHEGKPILYFNVGAWDLRRAIIAGESEKFVRYLNKGIDDGCTLVRKLSEEQKNVTQGILMINLEGYNLVEHGCLRCVPLVLQGVLSYEYHFPGCAEKIILLNTPGVFEPLLNVVRPVLSPPTNDALKIFGSNKREWKGYIYQYIDSDQLPPEIGGTKLYEGMADY